MLSGHISIKYNLKGPNSSPVTACATGTHAIGDSFTIIKNNKADLMVCGGAEAAICPLGVSGFSAARALCDSYNDNREKDLDLGIETDLDLLWVRVQVFLSWKN